MAVQLSALPARRNQYNPALYTRRLVGNARWRAAPLALSLRLVSVLPA